MAYDFTGIKAIAIPVQTKTLRVFYASYSQLKKEENFKMDNNWHFSGYATRNDLLCGDGRTIRRNAFKHCDGSEVPIIIIFVII